MRALGIALVVLIVASLAGVMLLLPGLHDAPSHASSGVDMEHSARGLSDDSSNLTPTRPETDSNSALVDVTNAAAPEATLSAESSSGSGFASDSEPGEPLVVRGRVVDEARGLPIANAEVAADRLFKDFVRTDADGRYEMTLRQPELYEFKVEARAPGFGRREHRVDDIRGTELTVDLELKAARRATGRLVTADGAPVANAEVSAHAAVQGSEGYMRDEVATRSRADGTFLLAELRPDLQHLLRVKRPGFATIVYAFPSDEKAEPEVGFGDITLSAASKLRVSVVDDGGAPLPDTWLHVTGGNEDWLRFASVAPPDETRSLWLRNAQCDASGQVCFDDLAPGTYEINPGPAGRAAIAPQSITIASPGSEQTFAFTFPRGLSIEGRVVDESGRPLFDQWVELVVDREKFFMLFARSDQTGRFRFAGLSAGSFGIALESEMDRFKAISPQDRSLFMPVDVGSCDVVLTRHASTADTLRGRVLDRSDRPVAQAQVWAYVDIMGVQTISHVGGRFSIRIPHGASARLFACAPDFVPLTSERQIDFSKAVTASAADGEVTLRYLEGDEEH